MDIQARTINENIIPKEVNKKLYFINSLEIFFLEMNLETFKDKTGNTQGIKFKINPPIREIRSIMTKECFVFKVTSIFLNTAKSPLENVTPISLLFIIEFAYSLLINI